MADTPKHSVSVAGIVVDDQDRVLVIQRRDNGHWEPPGGVLELKETLEQGVQREVFEETGVQVRVVGLSGIYKNMARGVVSLVFRCQPVGGTPQQTQESRRVDWWTQKQVDDKMSPVFAVRVTDALGHSGRVVSRAHDGEAFVYSA